MLHFPEVLLSYGKFSASAISGRQPALRTPYDAVPIEPRINALSPAGSAIAPFR